MPKTRTPVCPKCQAATAWIRSMPGTRGYVVHAYECPHCGYINSIVEPDPLFQAEGWLKSELKPPT